QVDADDGGGARPGPAGDADGAPGDARPGRRRDDERFHAHDVDGAALGRGREYIALRLEMAAESLRDCGDAPDPFDARHSVPAGDDEPARRAVLGRERGAVQLEGEEHVWVARDFDGERALEGAGGGGAVGHAGVRAGDEDLDRVVAEAGALEDGGERDAAP